MYASTLLFRKTRQIVTMSTKKTDMCLCHHPTQTITPSLYPTRREYLLNKKIYIKEKLSACSIDDYDCMIELTSELAKIREELKNINMDPLTYETCEKEPWIMECKVFD